MPHLSPSCPTRKESYIPADENRLSFRVPIDDVETFKEVLEAAAIHLDKHDKAHWQYWTVLYGLIHILQGPSGGEES